MQVGISNIMNNIDTLPRPPTNICWNKHGWWATWWDLNGKQPIWISKPFFYS